MPRPRSSSALARFAAAIVRIVAALALLWGIGLLWFLFSRPGPAPLTTATDGVVVLTGGPARIGRGVAVLASGAAHRMLVSGVNPEVTTSEFEAVTSLPTMLRRCCVELGQQATTTRGNAMEVADWVQRHRLRSIRLVTADYHMRRAQAEVSAALPAGVTLLLDAVPAPLPGLALIMEYNKLLAARALLLTGVAR